LSCEPTCTTTQYKSLTREHIESLGNDIVLTMGDQLNDLAGGFADYTAKVPNPMYYIP
jgi:HAD superfamily, subfamily IIIB (Acid phosphatase)